MKKTKKRKQKRPPSLPPATFYVADSSGKAELMLMEYCLDSNVRELETAASKIVTQLENIKARLREFHQKLQERKAI